MGGCGVDDGAAVGEAGWLVGDEMPVWAEEAE